MVAVQLRTARRLSSRSALTWLVALAGAASLLGSARTPTSAAGAPAAPPALSLPTRPTIAPVMACPALQQVDFGGIPEAPTSLTSTTLVGDGAAQYCEVKGWIAPQTQFELRLPTSTWQGRYLQTGCGGNCGVVRIGVSPPADADVALTNNTFAVASNNEGHTSTGPRDVWAAGGKDNPLRVQFGYLADHLTAVVAKQIIQTYYGTPPAFSYFDGYSDGGRAAVNEAQRYPGEFNGIVAGAPAIIISDAMESFIWAAQHGLDANTQPVLDSAAIATLHDAAMAACDASDGTVDQQISDPRLCHWDPAAIACSATLTSNCLNAAQVQAAQALYAGPTTPDGTSLWPGGQAYGSELAWPSFFQAGVGLGGSFTRYMAVETDPSGPYTYRDFKFDEATWRALQPMASIYNANNRNQPDLSAFKAAGGKLVVWQSWQDEAGGPSSVLDWYAQIQDRAGGLAATQQFARVFLLPAGSHGDASSGKVYDLQILPAVVGWVEAEQAPDQLDAVARDVSGSITRTYPVYAYPSRAEYVGTGDVNDAANWRPSTPQPADDHFDWLGDPAGR